ncbi:surface lipoprotein assembly modifier [Sphingomonas sp. AR_OL41]|uniref:surface lipoprotein assembly modifier n=1 Tax=Sphingomonas sp. AR_OL41 TaxID=3042729 RepID=UPI0024815796|nr:surface lipoprotein assembly modifier [Sphingomonas sp. AR_OL41]MDH7972320.1 surface lipoprotein assembly modifier [Sphingomonas sp. AR_OL41]
MALASIALPADATPCAQDGAPRDGAGRSDSLSVAQLFAFADAARDSGDFRTAETAYRALAANPDPQLRAEARYRLGMMLSDQRHDYRGAAIEFRRLLDEQPKSARVRLELARVLALMGNAGGAERELRAAEAAGLPPQVQQMVRFYANALATRKSFGGSLEASITPDSNVNRATRADTLDTVIGNFTLGQDARERSGVGLALRGQSYVRRPLAKGVNVLARVSGSAELYRDSSFDDVILALQGGPEFTSGVDRITLSAGPAWRWYGMRPYSVTVGGAANWQHPLGKRTLLRIDGGAGRVTNRLNALQDGASYSLAVAFDRAFSARAGGGVQLIASRQTARDRGYGDVTAAGSAYAFRELGRTTMVLGLSYRRLEADARLALFPRRRVDELFSLTASATWRALQIKGFAPFTRLRLERNRSTVGLYDYKRIAAEFGVTSTF